MSFPFALLRAITLSFIVITNVTLSILSAIAFHDKTGGVFQVLTVLFGTMNLLTILGCACHQFANREDDTSNAKDLCPFGLSGLLSFALATSLTVYARQDRGVSLCNDFASLGNPCIPAGIQLAMAYASLLFALVGFVISWIDKFPGAVKVTLRYPVTKAPSSRYAAHGHGLDGNYTHSPVKPTKSHSSSEWCDIPI